MTATRKSFLREIWGRAAPTYDWFQAIRESFLGEILTSYGSTKVFSLESLLLYSIHSCIPTYAYTQVYISQCFGTYQVGFTLIVLGVCSAIMSIVYSRLLKYLPRFLIIFFGVALSGSMLLFMLFWERMPSYTVIFIIAVGWGAADAVWTTMPTSRLPLTRLGCL